MLDKLRLGPARSLRILYVSAWNLTAAYPVRASRLTCPGVPCMQMLEERTDTVLDAKQLLSALNAFKKGDFSVRLDFGENGVARKVADAFNEALELNEQLVGELERISQVVGKAGRLTQRASLGDVGGSWGQAINSVNTLISNLVHPTVATGRVIGAVAK